MVKSAGCLTEWSASTSEHDLDYFQQFKAMQGKHHVVCYNLHLRDVALYSLRVHCEQRRPNALIVACDRLGCMMYHLKLPETALFSLVCGTE